MSRARHCRKGNRAKRALQIPSTASTSPNIHLIFRTKLDRARERALDQIEAVLHEPYPEIRLQDE